MRMMQDLAKDIIEKGTAASHRGAKRALHLGVLRFDRIEKCAIEKDQCGRGAVEALPIPRQAGTRAPGSDLFCAS